ncbi:hypothetical protein ABHQ57_08825 [Tenacibaculum sp. ZH5_bin.1]|uniref:hypothetical protein n=1 Tax=Tenacibaculum TaxID=104267 RepID=UPI001431B5FE|nr:hypothetical protein [Tenacibaculum mesophilum]KAF9657920.1 hypothetical protein HBA12_11920 [Tenacibaculum mesophilum]
MNNSGIIRQLKELKKYNSNNSEKKPRGDSNFISFLALIVSCIALYFQFFYYHYDLKTAFVSGGIENDSLNVNLVFHNQGNQDATVIYSRLWFYPKSHIEKPKSHLGFRDKKSNPFVLSKGEQKFHKINEPIDFKVFDFQEKGMDSRDTLKIELELRYLNNLNLITEKKEIIGWLTLDKGMKIEYFSLSFKNIEMESDTYISRTYREKKQ